MTLTDKVRAATSSLHQALDSALLPPIEVIRSKEDYAALLMCFYGFFKPVYDCIAARLDPAFLPDYHNRRKPDWILKDLKELDVPYRIMLCKHLPAIKDNASAFGAWYVLEGATLGGLIIKKMISEKLHLEDGFTFFGGYGRQTRERWNVFIQAVNGMNMHNGAEATFIQTAAATFTTFNQWLQHCSYYFLQSQDKSER